MSALSVESKHVELLLQEIHMVIAKDPTNTICQQIKTSLNNYYLAVSQSTTKNTTTNTETALNIPSLNMFSKLLAEVTDDIKSNELKNDTVKFYSISIIVISN